MRTNDGLLVNTDLATTMTFAHLETIAVLSQKISELGIYPAAEPLIFCCRKLDVSVVAHSHCDVARNTQNVRQDHESLQDHVVILGVYELSEKDKLTVARDCIVNSSCLIPSLSLRWKLPSLNLTMSCQENYDITPATAPKVGKLVNVGSLSLRLANWILVNLWSLDDRVPRIGF